MYRVSVKFPSHTMRQLYLSRERGVNTLNSSLSGTKGSVLITKKPFRSYGTDSKRRSNAGKTILYILGTAIAGTSGIIAYAQYDSRFRKSLNEVVPGSDFLIQFIFREDESHKHFAKSGVSNASANVLSKFYELVGFGEKSEEPMAVTSPTVVAKSKPNPAVYLESVPAKKPKEESTPEILGEKIENEFHLSKKDHELPETKLKQTENLKKYNFLDLEEKAVELAQKAISAFNIASNDLKEYREDVACLIEKSVQNDDFHVWLKIKEKTEQKKKSIDKAEKIAKKAMKKLEHLKLLIGDPKTDIDEQLKSDINEHIKNVINDLIYTKAVFAKEKNDSSISEKYANKVDESRKMLSKELGVLFPSLILDSSFVASEDELDLFVMYTCQLLNFYQKELEKLQTIDKSKIEKIIEQSKAGNAEMIREILGVETDTLKSNLAQELIKKELKLKLEFEKELRKILKRQVEIHNDNLQEVINFKDKETERKLQQNITEKVEDIRLNYNRQLAKIIGRMKGLDVALKEKATAEKQAKRSQLLWNACQSLILAINAGSNELSWEEQLKPLQNEINAISKAAADNDPLVEIVLSSIPSEAVSRGVFSELALKDRFLNVQKIALRLANLSSGYASIPKIFLSYLQSYLLVNLSDTISSAELANEPIDISKLNNYDILFRARYWLDRGDFVQTLKYMNLLKGASRIIADEWIKETRILLETQQAADVLLSHAVYSNLNYLQDLS